MIESWFILILLVNVVHLEVEQETEQNPENQSGDSSEGRYCFPLGSYCDEYTPCCPGPNITCLSRKCTKACSPLGNTCSSPDDCCPGANVTCDSTNTCMKTCSEVGGACTKRSDCCDEGLTNVFCALGKICIKICRPPGFNCQTDSDCCKNNICSNNKCKQTMNQL